MNQSTSHRLRPAWFEPLINALGLQPDSTAAEVLKKADAVANTLAPNTRRLWKWILTLEGVAVVLPLLWLLVLRLGWHPGYTAFAVLTCTLMIVGVCWWLRWRGMQHTWTRARLLAEIARSADACCWLPGRVTVEALSSAPKLQVIANGLPQNPAREEASDLESLKQRYLTERIQHQRQHYYDKRIAAIQERKHFSRWVTRSLDGALFLAVAGAALAISGKADYLLRISGSDYVMGLAGTSLPLVAILMQSLSSFLELNRRTGRYALQIDFLDAVSARLQEAATLSEAMAVVHQVENVLLGEVVEWFYQAEHAEFFYRSKNVDEAATITATVEQTRHAWYYRFLGSLSASVGFIVSVILGRLVIVAIAIVLTSAWIAWHVPKDYVATSAIHRRDGRLLSSATADGWNPPPQRAAHGFILIAHGLHDGANRKEDKSRWMERMQNTLEKSTEFKERLPDICLVDWHEAALDPSLDHNFLNDLAAIRSMGEEIGTIVGCKLAMAVKSGKIQPDQPMHFIGHSAGGFVVMAAARTLGILGIKPQNLRLTILDTPLPDVKEQGDLRYVARDFPLDYYCTSAFAQGVPAQGWLPLFSRFQIKREEKMNAFTDAHSYAYEWFINSIVNHDKEGFARSPFMQQLTPAAPPP